MEQLTPIPTPPAQRWREFRIQVLPVFTFIAVLLGVVALWSRYVLPSNIVAEVEVVRANIVSTAPGTLISLHVERFQVVTQGQVLGEVQIMSPGTYNAEVAAVQAELQVLKTRIQLDMERNRQNYETERLRFLQQRVDLAIARSRLNYLTNEAHRIRLLMEQNIESPSRYEAAALEADSARVSVEQMEQYLDDYARTLPRIEPGAGDTNESITEAIRAAEEKLRLETEPVTLRSPFSGVVSAVFHRAGTRIIDGDPILIISSMQSDRIVGYVKQPIISRPKVGDLVQVSRRSFQREVRNATIIEVGTQLEQISPTLLSPDTNPRVGELGLPFLVKVPEGMTLLPGESVDVILDTKLAAKQ